MRSTTFAGAKAPVAASASTPSARARASHSCAGAAVSWLSQYPGEAEILLPPLTVLQVIGTREHDSGAHVYQLRPMVSRASEVDGLRLSSAVGGDGKLHVPRGN